MKCSEELPECKNCRIRQVRIPCSYLEFSEAEKKHFLEQKSKQEGLAEEMMSLSPFSLPGVVAHSTVTNRAAPQETKVKTVKVKLISHNQNPPNRYLSTNFFGESPKSNSGRVYLHNMIQTELLSDTGEGFYGLQAFSSIWLYCQLKKRYEALLRYRPGDTSQLVKLKAMLDHLFSYSVRSKSKALAVMRCIISELCEEGKSLKEFSSCFRRQAATNYGLQDSDIIISPTLKVYHINGSVSILGELYNHLNKTSSPFTDFIMAALSRSERNLLIPCYSVGVLEEVREVLQEFKVFLLEEEDGEGSTYTILHNYSLLIEFLEYVSGKKMSSQYDPTVLMGYPPKLIYEVYHKFTTLLPSEIFTINNITSPTQKVFYCFYYSIAKILDNIFPGCRFLVIHRFIGPTSVYPFTIDDLYRDLPKNLIYFANYSMRLHAFFSRRIDFFLEYTNEFTPVIFQADGDQTKNRFASRVPANLHEVFISKFRKTLLKPWHYPQIYPGSNSMSEGDVEQPGNISIISVTSSNSNSFRSMVSSNSSLESSQFEKSLKLKSNEEEKEAEEVVDLFDVCSDTSLLNKDYDILSKEWGFLWTFESHPKNVSFGKYIEDRALIAEHFL